MQFNFDLKEAKRAAALTLGIAQALFIQGCYYSNYDYYYGGRYARPYYNGYYCEYNIEYNLKMDGMDQRCDVCIYPDGRNPRPMRCWDDWGAWQWVWCGIGIFLLVVLVGLLIWCCCSTKKNKGKIYDPNDPNAPLVVTSQQGNATTAQYTVAQLHADNARDADRQRQINERMANRQQAINALNSADQSVTASAGQEVIVSGGDHVVAPYAPGPNPARRQKSNSPSSAVQGLPVASSSGAAAVPANDDVFSPSNAQKV